MLTLFYTTCTGSCPITVKALQMFAEGEKSAGNARVRFVLITVDPAQDTLAALRKYRRTMHLERGLEAAARQGFGREENGSATRV